MGKSNLGLSGRYPTEATRLRFDQEKKSTTLNSLRVVIASWSRWWEKRLNELKVRPVGDCKVIFFLIESQSRRLSGRTAYNNAFDLCSHAAWRGGEDCLSLYL
jgi:hypothetical protein